MTPSPSPAAQGFRGLEFSLGGIPVLIRPAFFLLTIVFGAQGGSVPHAAIWVGIVFVSILIHELGHATAMRAFGFSPSIELHAMGGFTAWSRDKTPTAGQRLIVTACGPAAGLALGALVTVVLHRLGKGGDPLVHWAVVQAQWVNLGWSFINLLPVLPWDGGLIVDSAVEVVGRKPRPKIAAVVSLIVGAGVVIFGLYFRQIMLIYFGGVGVWQGYARLNPRKPDAEHSSQVWALMQAQRFAEAERLASEALPQTAELAERNKLLDAIAWSRLLRDDWLGAQLAIDKLAPFPPSRHLAATMAAHEGQHEAVVALLSPLPASTSELMLRTDALIALDRTEAVIADACDLLARSELPQRKQVQLLAARLFEAGKWEPSMQISLSAFKALGDPVHLLNAACAQVKLGPLTDALATLGEAITAGFKDRQQLLEDPDLAPLRSLPGWETTVARVGATSA